MCPRSVANSSLMLALLLLTLWTNPCHTAGSVTLLSNVTFAIGGLICPTPAVEFTCTAIDAPDIEWQRNGLRIIIFIERDTIGPRNDPSVPSGFEIELVAVERVNQFTANFTTTLTANLSVLMNGGDQISCHSVRGNDSINILYTGEQSPPPAPLFSHSFSSLRDGEVSLTLTWDETFTTTHAVQMYCVRSDLCPGEPCVVSDTPFSCPGLVAGGEYMFWVTAVNCGDQRGEESQPLVVRPQVPRMPTISSLIATYNETSAVVQLVVSWEPVSEIQIVDQITEPIWYRVTVEHSRSTGNPDRGIMIMTCEQSKMTCSALFPLLEAADYTVSISAMNIVGGSNTRVYPNEIFSSSSSYYVPVFSFENCITSVMCSSSPDLSDTTRCVVRYGTDPSYTLLSDPVDGPLNSMFQFPLLKPTTTYYFQTSVLINSSLTVQVQDEFTTGEFESRLLSLNIGLIIAGALLLTIGLITTVIDVLLIGFKRQVMEYNCFDVTMLVVIATFLLVATFFWVVVGLQVGLQQNTCDPNWQRHRNGLIITSFVFSVFAFSLSVILFFSIIRIAIHKRGSQQAKQEEVSKEGGVVSPMPEYDYIDPERFDTSTRKEKIDLDKNKAYDLRPVDAGSSSVQGKGAPQREIELQENVAYGPTKH